MNYTQNSKIMQVTEKTLVVGIDIASEDHYARVFDWRGIELGKVLSFENTIEGFNKFSDWIEKIKTISGKTKVIVGAEPTGHYWFGLAGYLKEKEMKLVLVNPFHVKRSKELDDNSPTKTDRKDPKTIAKLVIDGRYSEPYIPEGIYADLRIINEIRLRLTKEMIGIKNRVERWLKIYFPEYRKVFGDWSKKGSMMILKRMCLPDEIKERTAEEINKIWRDEKLRAVGRKRAEALIRAAKMSIGIKEGLTSARKDIQLLMSEYELKKEQYDEVMKEIEETCKKIKNVDKVLEIKGIGIITIAGFLSEVGDVNRFESPKQIQKLAGLSLMENSSGKHNGETSITKRGRKRLRQLLFQVAMPLIASNEEFKALHSHYIGRANNPLKKKQSIVALGCKLIRVLYTVLKTGTKYDSSKIMEAIGKKKEYQEMKKAV